MKVSDILIDKLKQFEGYRAKAYRCPAGVWTCGYGHTKGVTARTVCDKAKAEEWLRADLAPIEAFLSAVSEVCKSQGSHPTWVRGLKLLLRTLSMRLHSRTLRGCVD